MKKVISLLSVFLISIFVAVTASAVFDINPFVAGAVSFAGSFVPLPGASLYSLLFTAPGGIAAPFAFQCKGLPQFLSWNNVVPLTSLRVETQEDGVLHEWVALSLAAMNGYMVLGAQAANIFQMRLASAFLKNKNVTISGVTSAAGAIGFYGFSDGLPSEIRPGYCFKSSNAAILALQPTEFSNFTAIWVPTMAAVTDTCQVEYRDGHVQTFNINDLASASSLFQEVPAIMVNNINAYIHKATFTCAAATAAYILSIKV